MEDENVIEVKGVYKNFKLPTQKVNSIKSIFTSLGRNRRREYKIQKALEDISFTVKKGEFFGIVGRNGSGKSTLLKLLAGIYQPTRGSIVVKGKVVPFIELGVGFKQELSGRDNVYLNGAMLGFTVKQIDAKYDGIVEFAELERFMEQKLSNYSSGMQVRLAFSVATILAESDVLLLDEVLAVGDADFQRKCFDYFRQLKKLKKTVIFISHDMDAVREYCDRAILLDSSRIQCEGSSEIVALEYKKLFTNKNKQEDSVILTKRWGEKTVSYTSLELSSDSLTEKDESFKVVVKAKAKSKVEHLVFGFSITDDAGKNLFGTNTTIKKLPPVSLRTEEEIEIRWEIPNIFSDGNYFINVAIVDSSGTVTYDWWDEALKFRVYSEEKTPYPVNPKILVGIKKI